MKGLFKESDSLVYCPIRSSGDTYSFLHKSLQECFAAIHIADQTYQSTLTGQQEQILMGEKFLTNDVAVRVDQRVKPTDAKARPPSAPTTPCSTGPRALGSGV